MADRTYYAVYDARGHLCYWTVHPDRDVAIAKAIRDPSHGWRQWPELEAAGWRAEVVRVVAAPRSLGVTPDVARRILAARDALAADDTQEAWHQLYSIADPTFATTYQTPSDPADHGPWSELERVAGLRGEAGGPA